MKIKRMLVSKKECGGGLEYFSYMGVVLKYSFDGNTLKLFSVLNERAEDCLVCEVENMHDDSGLHRCYKELECFWELPYLYKKADDKLKRWLEGLVVKAVLGAEGLE